MSDNDTPQTAGETVKVNIYDQTYSLRSASGSDYIRHIARIVDERMRHIAAHTTTFDLVRIAVLAALNITDELQRLQTQYAEHLQPAAATSSANNPQEQKSSDGVANASQAKPQATSEGQSWFEAIFDEEMPVRERSTRLSNQVAAKLQSRRQDETPPLSSNEET